MNYESAMPDEAVLIENVKSGQRSSFDALVNLYQQRGLGIAYNMVGNAEDARDVLQEAFVKMYVHLKHFEGRSKFSTWFYRIVVNCALDFLRRRKRAARVFVDIADGHDEGKSPLEVADVSFEPRRISEAKEFAHTVDECIAKLSKMQKSCFILKHQNKLTISEIAEMLKCNPSTVKVHLFRAVENLRKHLACYLKAEGGL